jgi:hypothetical protein
MSTIREKLKEAYVEGIENGCGRPFNSHDVDKADLLASSMMSEINRNLSELLTQQKVREMIPQLEWRKVHNGYYEVYIPIERSGIYHEAIVPGASGFICRHFETGVVKFETFEESKQACQKDFEDRVLRCLGFEPKNEEG